MDDNGELLVALTDLEIARAELAAANKAANDLQVVLTHAFEDIANVKDENAALSARLERVRALADEWERQLSETRFWG